MSGSGANLPLWPSQFKTINHPTPQSGINAKADLGVCLVDLDTANATIENSRNWYQAIQRNYAPKRR